MLTGDLMDVVVRRPGVPEEVCAFAEGMLIPMERMRMIRRNAIGASAERREVSLLKSATTMIAERSKLKARIGGFSRGEESTVGVPFKGRHAVSRLVGLSRLCSIKAGVCGAGASQKNG
jgi:hypothetical protein